MSKKVRKKTNTRNRYNQVPDLTKDSLWERDKITRKRRIEKRLGVSSQGRRPVFKSGPTEETTDALGGA